MLMVRVVPVFLFACANAGGASPPVDSRGVDAPRLIDAPVVIDAPRLVDAPIAIDAPVDAPSGPFCTLNTDCTGGDCCFNGFGASSTGFCTEGTVILGFCTPAT